MEREYPHDLEAERALLGAMLIDKDACAEVINVALPQDFYYDKHKMIFEGMKYLHDSSVPVDVTTLTTYLMDKKILDKVILVKSLFVSHKKTLNLICDHLAEHINMLA